jgi:uncharacterized membrane protein YjgN (DUF898 family)
MTAFDAPTASAGAVQFLGRETTAYWRLRIKGASLLMFTLGLYRFWFATDVRRFLWSNTETKGDTLEYTGLATELLVGFLFAVAILVPLYTVFAIGALEFSPRAPVSVAAGIILITLLAEFALYRARRYRLTRTVFRGVQFEQQRGVALCTLRGLVVVGHDRHARARLSLGAGKPAALQDEPYLLRRSRRLVRRQRRNAVPVRPADLACGGRANLVCLFLARHADRLEHARRCHGARRPGDARLH